MLPPLKSSLPKCLYLDQNKWIDLARARYGRDGGARYSEALRCLEEAVGNGSLLVPMSAVHVMETMAPLDEGRRRRLAEFMVELSGNLSIVPHFTIRPLEITHAVLRKLGQQPATSIRTNVLQRGISYAMGAEASITATTPEMAAEMQRIVNSPAMTVECLVHAGDREAILAERQEDEAVARDLDDIRRRATHLSEDMKHKSELIELYTRGQPGAELQATLHKLGFTMPQFFDGFLPEEFLPFFHDVPTIDVLVTLSLARDRERHRLVDRNDLKDIGFMSIALPYANIVVGEKFWTHIASATGLDDRYVTIVESDAAALPHLLRTAGCI